MPLVTQRSEVLDVYARAADRGWVIPTFNSENLTTSEAVLAAAAEYARRIGVPDLPVGLGITNLYPPRPQATYYTHSGRWDVGLELFLADLKALTADGSAYAGLKVLVHLDHIQPSVDGELLEWDMERFSSIMYDASMLPMDQNVALTAEFVERRGGQIVIEGACDEIGEASGEQKCELTTPQAAERFAEQTGVDLIVANLGTEHRASLADRRYRGDLARRISERIGPRLVLHGTSSVEPSQAAGLFDDGIRKVNIWTALERDSSPALLEDMVANAAKVAGPQTAGRLQREGLLGPRADTQSAAAISHFTTHHRRQIVFEQMKRIVTHYLELFYGPQR